MAPVDGSPSRPVVGRGGRVTIQQVAESAGVSIATVSRVMRGSLTVRADLADRVRLAADGLGYRPNPTAQGLATGMTRMIGVVVPTLANPYFDDVIKSLNAEASAAGYRMLIADANDDADEELELSHSLQRQVDALILVSPRMPVRALRALEDEARPVVLVNRAADGIGLPSVAVDTYAAMLALCGHLASLGHTHIAYLAGPTGSWPQQERWRAIEAAAASGLHVTAIPAGSSIEAGHAALEKALVGDPTAVMAFNDLVAVGALSRLAGLGIEVPREMSVTGFDDIAFARFVRPPLTTAASPQSELGRQAWGLVVRVLAGERPGMPAPLPAPLAIRESTAPPRERTGRQGRRLRWRT
jgi:LacI family repressor for deo operon, udp, cdd, tsx, nupC, and nupG